MNITSSPVSLDVRRMLYLTGSALYWTLWVLPSTSLCERSPTEKSINVASPRGRAYLSARAGPQYIRRPHLPPVILFSSASRINN